MVHQVAGLAICWLTIFVFVGHGNDPLLIFAYSLIDAQTNRLSIPLSVLSLFMWITTSPRSTILPM